MNMGKLLLVVLPLLVCPVIRAGGDGLSGEDIAKIKQVQRLGPLSPAVREADALP
jgi:hypothetical protein